MNQSISDLLDLLNVPGVSTEENRVADHLKAFLKARGVPAGAIREDRAFEQSEYGGTQGNILVRLPARGGHKGAARFLCAHIDTVALCRQSRPRFVPDPAGGVGGIVNDNPEAALGADNRSGVAVLLHVLRALTGDDRPHPPIWIGFLVQEELGLIGARGLDLDAMQPDRPVMGFNFDGGRPHRVVTAVIGTSRVLMELHGKAAHAGVSPQKGVSCAVAMAKALADLARGGWHGLIEKPEGKGTANIGILRGGEMTNTVMDRLIVHGDVRSHDTAFRNRLVDLYVSTFEKAAADTRNAAGEAARLTWKLGPCYDSFALDAGEPVVRTAMAAVRSAGLDPEIEINDGGMDANHLNAKGLPTVTLGTGQSGAHTVEERIDLELFLQGCRIAETVATL
ncbi:MAG: Carboxypeptidase G2 [Phycisphaerae bacterium]|nr:Carboxypeptidase G2 [Phycisphaerae bacterium]